MDLVNKIICGDVLKALKTFPDNYMDCCVTSPPYWGLRDYGIDGQLGLEKTPEEYVAKMVEVFREVKRVLKKEGTLWLNLGDSYAGSGCSTNDYHTEKSRSINKSDVIFCKKPPQQRLGRQGTTSTVSRVERGRGFYHTEKLKPKDLCGIPWRVAFALQADGWWLRQDIIWAKPNPMPESVTDRCTKSHEYVFLMTKSANYYFNNEAIKEKADYDGRNDTMMKGGGKYADGDFSPMNVQGVWMHSKGCERWPYKDENNVPVRNRRSVWTIATQPFPGAHFATFPEKLIEPMIKAGTSEKGCCSKCGKARERIVKKSGGTTGKSWHDHNNNLGAGMSQQGKAKLEAEGGEYNVKTIGWQPTCKCENADVVSPIVLDPFMGSGTVALVAKKLGVNYTGIELNQKYIEMAEKRINRVEENLFKVR